MPSNDREVFQYFRAQPNTTREIQYLAYAGYAYAKNEWIEHFQNLYGRPPDIGDENGWIAQLPDSRLKDITQDAIDFFAIAARSFMAEEIEREKKLAVDASILREVRRATKFASTFWPNLTIGVVASLAFTLLVILFGYIFNHDPSPVALFKALGPSPGSHQGANPATMPPQ